MLWIHKGFFIVKRLLYVRIKAFWYTNSCYGFLLHYNIITKKICLTFTFQIQVNSKKSQWNDLKYVILTGQTLDTGQKIANWFLKQSCVFYLRWKNVTFSRLYIITQKYSLHTFNNPIKTCFLNKKYPLTIHIQPIYFLLKNRFLSDF